LCDPKANGDEQLDEPTKGHHPFEPLSDRRAGELLLAFLGAVVLVLALATLPLTTADSATTQESSGHGVLGHRSLPGSGER